MEEYNPKVPDWLRSPLDFAQKNLQQEAKISRKETFAEKVLRQAKANRDYITLGEFHKASYLEPHKLDEIKAIMEAVEKDDTQKCDCKDREIAPGVFAPRHFLSRWVYSVKHSKLMPLMKCSLCGHLNVTEDFTDSYQKFTGAQEKTKDIDVYSN